MYQGSQVSLVDKVSKVMKIMVPNRQTDRQTIEPIELQGQLKTLHFPCRNARINLFCLKNSIYIIFYANVAKILTCALWGQNFGSNWLVKTSHKLCQPANRWRRSILLENTASTVFTECEFSQMNPRNWTLEMLMLEVEKFLKKW